MSRPVVHLEADIALPKAEDLAYQVVLEVLHGGQHVEHRRLLHPVREAEELCRHSVELVRPLGHCAFLGKDMDHTLRRDSEVLIAELLLIEDNLKVIRAEELGRNLSAVAVEELNWSGITVLGKEADSLFAALNLDEHLVDGSALADEVGLPRLRRLVLALVLIVFNDLTEFLEVN